MHSSLLTSFLFSPPPFKIFLHGNFGEYVQLLFSALLQLDLLHYQCWGEKKEKEELRLGLCMWRKSGGGGSGEDDAGGERIAEADDFLLLSIMLYDSIVDNSWERSFLFRIELTMSCLC